MTIADCQISERPPLGGLSVLEGNYASVRFWQGGRMAELRLGSVPWISTGRKISKSYCARMRADRRNSIYQKTGGGKITSTLIDPSPTPLLGALPMLFGGLGGLYFLTWRTS